MYNVICLSVCLSTLLCLPIHSFLSICSSFCSFIKIICRQSIYRIYSSILNFNQFIFFIFFEVICFFCTSVHLLKFSFIYPGHLLICHTSILIIHLSIYIFFFAYLSMWYSFSFIPQGHLVHLSILWCGHCPIFQAILILMQLHTSAEHFGNVIFRYSELTSQHHFDASIDVNRTWCARNKTTVSQSGTVVKMYSFKRKTVIIQSNTKTNKRSKLTCSSTEMLLTYLKNIMKTFPYFGT